MYPRYRYHPTEAPKGRRILDAESEAALGEGWFDTPAKFPAKEEAKSEPQSAPEPVEMKPVEKSEPEPVRPADPKPPKKRTLNF